MAEAASGSGAASNPFVTTEDYAYLRIPVGEEDPRAAAWARVQGAQSRVDKAKATLGYAEQTLKEAEAELAQLEKAAK
jgi:hypothetical protein